MGPVALEIDTGKHVPARWRQLALDSERRLEAERGVAQLWRLFRQMGQQL